MFEAKAFTKRIAYYFKMTPKTVWYWSCRLLL